MHEKENDAYTWASSAQVRQQEELDASDNRAELERSSRQEECEAFERNITSLQQTIHEIQSKLEAVQEDERMARRALGEKQEKYSIAVTTIERLSEEKNDLIKSDMGKKSKLQAAIEDLERLQKSYGELRTERSRLQVRLKQPMEVRSRAIRDEPDMPNGSNKTLTCFKIL